MSLLSILMVLLLAFPAQVPQSRPKSHEQRNKPADTSARVIDINQASAEDFAKLPGIGPKLANRIVAFRQKHGPFRRTEDLLAIRGLGPKKWKALRPYLRVGSSPAKETR